MLTSAATLCATPLRTFTHVLLPSIFPALLSGFTLAFARAIGEYGSVVFISGNMPLQTEIAPLLIIVRVGFSKGGEDNSSQSTYLTTI